MKIWSLLPSATEILFALGLADEVTGVTHECDYPPTAASKPRVTVSYIDSSLSSREIDGQVASRLKEGRQLYGIDRERLLADPPDVIVTQDLCPVCAVSPSDFAGYLEEAGCKTRLVTPNPNTLNDVLESVRVGGDARGRAPRGRIVGSSGEVVCPGGTGRQREMAPRSTRDLILQPCQCLYQAIGRQVPRELQRVRTSS